MSATIELAPLRIRTKWGNLIPDLDEWIEVAKRLGWIQKEADALTDARRFLESLEGKEITL